MVGSAENTGGGVTTVIKLIKKMPVWKKYSTYWLGTQCQGSKWERAWYGISAAIKAPFLIWRYDIIHFHNVPGTGLYTQMPAFLCAKLYGKKTIFEAHVGNQLNDNTNNKLFKWWLKHSDLVLFLAKKWEDLYKEKFSDIKTPSDVLYNACEIKEEVPMSEKKKSVIMAAFLTDNKAPDLLLKAWVSLKNKNPDWSLTLMGNGEVERYKAMAHDLGLDDVAFPGYLTGEEKEKQWREASIYCMCSYQEGFPMVVLEAWNYGISVVTTPVGGLPDVIEEGKNCLTFPFGDSDALASQLDKLMSDEQLRTEMAEYSRQFGIEHFSLETINAKLESIYERLLNV